MIKDGKLYIGGNKFFFKFGNFLKKWSDNLIKKGKQKVVTNPTAKMVNPFAILISFTVDGNNKYQLIIQGDFKSHYRDCEDNVPNIEEKELLLTIKQKANSWYKKE